MGKVDKVIIFGSIAMSQAAYAETPMAQPISQETAVVIQETSENLQATLGDIAPSQTSQPHSKKRLRLLTGSLEPSKVAETKESIKSRFDERLPSYHLGEKTMIKFSSSGIAFRHGEIEQDGRFEVKVGSSVKLSFRKSF